MTHARLWYELLNGKPTTAEDCLRQAAMGEYSEWHEMYPRFAEQARADGLESIAVMFEHVASIEKKHENEFMTLLASLQKKDPAEAGEGSAKKRVKKQGYRCQFCGEIFDHRPDVCPTCQAIGAFDAVEYYE